MITSKPAPAGKTVKKALSVLLSVLMLVSCFSCLGATDVLAFGPDDTLVDYGTCGTNLQWELYTDGILRITGSGAMTNYTQGNVYGQNVGSIPYFV